MSEYWVSKKKYFCKYCDIYIADDAPSRQQHENGLRHTGNRDRFIRGLYKEGERRKKDAAEEKAEMARVERAAQAAFSQDIGSGHAKASSSSSTTTAHIASSSTKLAPKTSNPYANYSTAASLGYTDPDAERLAAIAEQRRTEGLAGQWQVVDADDKAAIEDTALGKRPAEPEDDQDARHFKLRKRAMEVGMGKIYDPGAIKLKPKKEEPAEAFVPKEEGEEAAVKPEVEAPVLKFKSTGWMKAASEDVDKEQILASDLLKAEAKKANKEEEEDAAKLEPKEEEENSKVKLELPVEDAPQPVLFKKRKPATAGTRGKRTP